MANLSSINGKFVVEQTTGYVGVGTTDPSYPIEVLNASAEIALNASGGSIYRVQSDSASNFIIRKEGVGDRLVINSAGNSTFAGTVLIDGVSNYTGLTVKGSGASRPQIKFSNVNQGVLGQIYGTEANALVTTTIAGLEYQVRNANGASGDHIFKSYNTAILTLDGATNAATFAGNVALTGDLKVTADAATADIVAQWADSNGNNCATFRTTTPGQIFEIRSQNSGTLKFDSTSSTFSGDAVSQYITSTSGSQATLFIGRSIDTQAKITSGDVSANDLCFYVNNTRRLVIENGGDVGIGTDSPSDKLQIGQGHSILVGDYFQLGSGSSDIMGALGWNRDTTDGVIYNTSFGAFQMHNNQGKLCLQGYNASGTNQFQHEFYNNGNIFFNGNVGIGTTSPDSKLHVEGSSGDNNLFAVGDVAIPTSGAEYGVAMIKTASTEFALNITSYSLTGKGVRIYNNGNNGPRTSFEILQGSGSKFIVDGIGNVGIGTDSPGRGLTIDKSNQYAALEIIKNNTTNQIVYLGTGSSAGTDDPILQMKHNGTENIRLYSTGDSWIKGGDLSIGTDNSSASAGVGVKITRATNNEKVSVVSGNFSAGAEGLTMYSTSAGNFRFYVDWAGGIHATNTSIIAISDITLKENIKPLETGLDEIMKLQPRRFDWKNGDGKNIAGFVAQEVEEVLPDLVSDYKYTDEETKKSLKMGDMIPTLVKAIQELKAEIEILKNK
jgi:hypothetical protein